MQRSLKGNVISEVTWIVLFWPKQIVLETFPLSDLCIAFQAHVTLIKSPKAINNVTKYKLIWRKQTNTVNVVIFAGGKFRENVGKTFHVGVIFTILYIFS